MIIRPAESVDSTAPALRPPSEVMRLERMGAFHPTRLSFMRILIRRLSSESARVSRQLWEFDADGYGSAVYSLNLAGRNYSLCAFTAPLSESERTDRVIATRWDATFALYDGLPTASDLERIKRNVSRQEQGRYSPKELVISRANKSVRLFEHVVDRLTQGLQPHAELVKRTGYLMRTTAVYGNGKFGIADRHAIADRAGFREPFQAELLTVWLIRGFTLDLVEHIAKSRGPGSFAPLRREFRRHLGIGNATGLGMAPFLVSHPMLLNNWMIVRETALARVRKMERASEASICSMPEICRRASKHLREWNVEDERQMFRIETARREFENAMALVSGNALSLEFPWDRLMRASKDWSLETQELMVSIVLEPNGETVDGLAESMSSSSMPCVDPNMTLSRLDELISENYAWAKASNFEDAESRRLFWYVSEEKLEPRLGDRFREPGSELELPLDVAFRVNRLANDLHAGNGGTVAEFLSDFPEHRHAVRRVQCSANFPYSEIRDNLTGSSCRPIDMLRCKLSFFGATKFDPKSDLWTRITMFQGAPTFETVAADDPDGWFFPVFGE